MYVLVQGFNGSKKAPIGLTSHGVYQKHPKVNLLLYTTAVVFEWLLSAWGVKTEWYG